MCTSTIAQGYTRRTSHERPTICLRNEQLTEARAGKRVIVDAAYLKEEQRLAFFGACCAAGLNPFFINCFAAEPVLKKRVERRMSTRADVSDGYPAILEKQLAVKEEPTELPFFRVFRLNTDEDLETIQKALRELLL